MGQDPFSRMVRRHKSALTRAKNSGDPAKVVVACEAALADFERYGYPDAWANWQVALEDARWQIARAA